MKLLIQPGEGVESLLNSIDRAKTGVEIAIFRFNHKGIEEALIKAVKRGVIHRNAADRRKARLNALVH